MRAKLADQPETTPQKSGNSTKNRMPRGIYKGTREEWLEEVMEITAVWLQEAMLRRVGTLFEMSPEKLPRYTAKAARAFVKTHSIRTKEIRISTSLLSSGMNVGAAGAHVQLKHQTGNGFHEIRMGADMGGRKTTNESIRVAGIVMHEMLHTMTVGHGHRGEFVYIGREAGLTGKPTAMMANPDTPLHDRLKKEVVQVLGRYPHKAVKLNHRMAKRGQRGIGSRSIKCECSCGCIVRLTRVWIDKAEGAIYCPVGGIDHDLMVVHL